MVADGLKSYSVAQSDLLTEVRHPSSRSLNNRAENSHRPIRARERQMQRFKSAGKDQRFLSAHRMIDGHFRPRRHLMTAGEYRRVPTPSVMSLIPSGNTNALTIMVGEKGADLIKTNFHTTTSSLRV